MKLVGAGGQYRPDHLYDASGTITTGGTSQLLLAQSLSRSYLAIQNLDATKYLYIEFGSARATATISGGKVTSCTVTNGGFGFTYPPVIEFLGGGNAGNSQQKGVGQAEYWAPGWSAGGTNQIQTALDHPATARCVLTGGVVTSIVINDPGQGYVVAPYVFIRNNHLDPIGVADPYYNSTNTGFQIVPAGSMSWESTICTTDAVSIWGSSTGQAFTAKFMTA